MIDLDERRDVTVVHLAHGGANVLDLELCGELSATLERLERKGSAVVLTGRGRCFSAGVDLVRVVEGGADYVRAFLPALSDTARRVFAYPAPLVAAINGHAIAGGCLVACAADRRWMAVGGGGIGVPELEVGVPFPAVAMEILRFSLPGFAAQRLVMSGRILDPAAARRSGLVDELAPPEELLDRAVAEARQLASIPAGSFELTKRQLRGPALARLQVEGPALDERVSEVWSRPEVLDRVGEYVERTLKKRRG